MYRRRLIGACCGCDCGLADLIWYNTFANVSLIELSPDVVDSWDSLNNIHMY